MYLYLKCSVKENTCNTNFLIINQHKNDTCHGGWGLCKRTFTLVPLVPLTMFSPKGHVLTHYKPKPNLCDDYQKL